MKLIRCALGIAVFAALSFGADAVLLGLVPAGARMVAGIDIDRAKDSALGQKILNEIKEEESGFRKLVEQTGFDPRRDLRSVVMASTGKPGPASALVVVRGTFDITRITRLAEGQGAVSSLYRGVQVWAPKPKDQPAEGTVAFLDPTLAVFGGEAMVKAAIDAKLSGPAELPAALANKLQQWSASNDAWFVSTASFRELGVGKTGQNAILPGGLTVDSIKEAAAGVRFSQSVDISGDILTRSAQDATALADVMRFLASMIRLNASKPGGEIATAVADSLQVDVNGSSTRFSLLVPEGALDQMFLNTRSKRTARASAQKTPASR